MRKRRTTTRMLLTSLVSMAASGAQAFDNQAAMAFSRANAGKFRTEVTEIQGVTVGKTITVNGLLDYIDVMALGLKYNPDSVTATPKSLARLGSLKIHEKCVPKGSFGSERLRREKDSEA